MTSPKERPILFNGEMVRAILDGRKTQTRRVMKLQPTCTPQIHLDEKWGTVATWPGESEFDGYDCHCPFQLGQSLWVREAWRVGAWRDPPRYFGDSEGWRGPVPKYDGPAKLAMDYKASPELVRTPWIEIDRPSNFEKLIQQSYEDCKKSNAKKNPNGHGWIWEHGKSPCRWRPSIHMPRWASRIDMLIKDVCVERVQEITLEDMIAEGIKPETYLGAALRGDWIALWDSINEKRGYGWDANPWVWVVKFERIKS